MLIPIKLFHLARNLLIFQFLTVATGLILRPASNSTENRLALRDLISFGIAQTVRTFPFATFHEIEATSKRPTTNPDHLKDVRLIFKGDVLRPIIIVEMMTWGRWNPPRISHDHEMWPLDDAVLPRRLRLDIRDADIILKGAGFTEPYLAVDVKAFSEQGELEQPWWIFLMQGEHPSHVWVGDQDGTVLPDEDFIRSIGNRNGSVSVLR